MDDSLDRGHPRMADSLAGAAAVYAAQGDFDAARALGLRALEVREEALGPDHPRTAATLDALAALHGRMGEPEQAAKFTARAAAIRAMRR